MSLNDTPKGERPHIAFFGKRNVGKSSIINKVTGQDLAIVSHVKGTTTDPVYKAMELLPLGPVMVIDTPGLDDEGVLGEKRMEKTWNVLNKTDLAIVVLDMEDRIKVAKSGNIDSPHLFNCERDLIHRLTQKGIPYLCIWNKYDSWLQALKEHPEYDSFTQTLLDEFSNFFISTKTDFQIHELKERIAALVPIEEPSRIIGDMLKPNDIVVLVIPIDKAAPKGRLILPQQQTIRDILDSGAISMVTKDSELKETLNALKAKPRLVITDSQAFQKVSIDTPADIPLTSFSILFARYKGELESLIEGVRAVEYLKDGDLILMAEGCTHHRQCDDIGTVKIPKWLKEKTKKDLIFETSSGTGYPSDISQYALIVHCGACMLNQREMRYRIERAKELGVPIVNYGILIAYINGILERSLEPFADSL